MEVFGSAWQLDFGSWPRREAKPWTAPFPNVNGIKFRLLGGDICDPGGWELKPFVALGLLSQPSGAPAPATSWFNSNPTRLRRAHIPFRCLPFFSWKIGRWGGYMGFKIYGVDAPEYRDWLPQGDVFDGSRAMCLSFRLSLSR